jgi:probable phosphoglycerate mutase
MKKLVLIQHCQSKHHLDGSVKEGPDKHNGLTSTGGEQAESVAERIKRAVAQQNDVTLYASDLQRAKETAIAVSDATGLDILYESGLREWMGDLEIKGFIHYRRNSMGDYSLFDWSPFLEGPSWREFYERVSHCMKKIESNTNTDNAIIVSHGGTVSNIVAWWLNLPLDVLSERTPFAGKPGSISVLVKNEHNNNVVLKLNDTSHLDNNRLTI